MFYLPVNKTIKQIMFYLLVNKTVFTLMKKDDIYRFSPEVLLRSSSYFESQHAFPMSSDTSEHYATIQARPPDQYNSYFIYNSIQVQYNQQPSTTVQSSPLRMLLNFVSAFMMK
jgi:hypothetical protein